MRTILTYHSIDSERSRLSVAPEAFRRQLNWLVRLKVPLMTVSDLLEGDRGGVAIAFDDGFDSVITAALPLLAGLGIPATVFPIVAGLGRRICWADAGGDLPKLRLMTPQAILELRMCGWEVGSHTLDHRCLIDLSGTDLSYTLTESKKQLETIAQQQVSVFAYPNGCHSARTRTAVARAGYRWALGTSTGQVSNKARYQVRRVNVGQTTTPARFAAAFVPPVQAARRAVHQFRAEPSGHTHSDLTQTASYL